MDIAEENTSWTEASLEALFNRLYIVGRRCQACGLDKPTFVLPARNANARHIFEQALACYLVKRYGMPAMNHHADFLHSNNAHGETIIRFPCIPVTLVLMDC